MSPLTVCASVCVDPYSEGCLFFKGLGHLCEPGLLRALWGSNLASSVK